MKENLSKKCGIYKIENVVNGKLYVGSSVNLANRKHQHFTDLKRGKHKNPHLQNAYHRYGRINLEFSVLEIIGDSKFGKENSKYVLEREQHWMETTNCIDREYGYNIHTIAGSSIGKVVSEKTKAKLSKAHTGKKITKQARENMSLAQKGKIIPKKVREAAKKAVSKPVINLDTGKRFDSVTEASNFYNINNTTISYVCNGKRESCGGYKWAYILEDGTISYPNYVRKSAGKKVINLDTGEIFNSAREATKKYNVSSSSLSDAVRGRRNTIAGYRWGFVDKEDKNKKNNKVLKSKASPVINLTTNKVFNSIKEAAEFYNMKTSHIGSVCRGERKKSGGYEWKYLDENNNVVDIECKPKKVNKKHIKNKKVRNITTGIVYESAVEAGKAYDARCVARIRQCCKGKAATAFGCKWEFVN